ncbi:hypothetical protein [Bergeyella cardium]|uniref:hypothetical protein n=1 Tax=Bergeyella cardium TaxID=1585976 RepID=UPI000EA16334|nr:hypothetical protein [Bergeyella cardium]
MTTIKRVALAIGLVAMSFVSAQSADMRNILKLGLNSGASLPSNNSSFVMGIDASYQNISVAGIGWGFATGYIHHFGKENNGIDNNDFGVIPAALLFRLYPKQLGFYLGGDLGYGFITGNDKVAKNNEIERPKGGIYFKPEIGFHNRDWNLGIHYQKVFIANKGKIGEQKYSAANFGVTLSYNIPLGK